MTLRRFALGAAVEALLLGLLLVWPSSTPKPPRAMIHRQSITLVAPLAAPRELPPLPKPTPKPSPRPEPPVLAELSPKPVIPPAREVAPVAPKEAIQPTAPIPEPPKPEAPKPVPVLGLFEQAVAEAPKPRRSQIEAALEEAPLNTRRPTTPAIVAAGFDAEAGPATPKRKLLVEGTGFNSDSTAASRSRRQVQLAAALDMERQMTPTRRENPDSGAFRPVEILTKPKPAYTQVARNFGIEGEVILQVRFLASGRLEVLQVIRGLGHGLDENAALAAAQVQFRPAERNGTPVDQLATMRVQFQLAN